MDTTDDAPALSPFDILRVIQKGALNRISGTHPKPPQAVTPTAAM